MDEKRAIEGTALQETNHRVVMDVRNITKSLPLGRERIDILKGITFQILGGEFISIVGPSGSGKSTLLGIIAGLDNPSSGQVLIDGFSALALLVDATPFGRMMGNVYLRIARPGIPTQLFSDEARAIAWLSGYQL